MFYLNLQKFTIDLKISQLEKLYVSTASDKWDPIREITTFMQEISLTIDDFLDTLQQAGIFNHTGTFTHNDVSNTN